MADREKIIRYYKGTEGADTAVRLVDIAEQTMKNRKFRQSDFLDPYGIEIAETVAANYEGLRVDFSGGYPGAERQRAIFVHEDFMGTPSFDIVVVRAAWNGQFYRLSHRDVLGALIGLQLALDRPEAVSALTLVNGWLSLSPHTRRCFQVRERLLHAGGAQAWVEAQPLFLYPAEWMAARLPRLEAEDALAISHFQGKENLLKRLQALKQADFSRRAAAIACPTLIISAADDLLVPASCSRVLQTAIPGSQLVEMPWGGHACNVTDADTFNTILRDGLAAMLPVARETR